jgi:hypothetical protein
MPSRPWACAATGFVDPSGLGRDHRELLHGELGVPGRRTARHEPAGGHHLDQVGAALVVGADDAAQVVLAVGFAAHEPAVPAGDGDRGPRDHHPGAPGQALGDGVPHDHVQVGPRAQVAGGGHAHAEQVPRVAQHQHQLLLVGLGAHPRGRIRPAVEPEVHVAVDQPGHDRRARVVRPQPGRVLGRHRRRGTGPVHGAVAENHRPVRDGLLAGDDERGGQYLLRHGLSLPHPAGTDQVRG